MDFLRCLNAFTSHMDVPNYPAAYYTIVRRDLDLIKSAAYVAMTIVSDGLIVSVCRDRIARLSLTRTGLPNLRRLGPQLDPRGFLVHPSSR